MESSLRELTDEGMEKRLQNVKEYSQAQIIAETKRVSSGAWDILNEITAFIKPGLLESEATEKAEEIYQKYDVQRLWHPTQIRFGKNTTLTYMDTKEEDIRLKEDDIAYVDIGVVLDGIEGDVGHTLVFGKNLLFKEMQKLVQETFKQAVAFWRQNNCTGIELYNFVVEKIEAAGFEFNLKPTAGHLIGAYPHKGWKRGLNTYPNPVESGMWVLEVQCRHPKLPYGAFYEDVVV